MYNARLPKDNELPSSKQLFTSTLMAIALAIVLLITTILPAEYGIDPTGIGRQLGLTEMGEIKVQLAEELAAEQAVAAPTETPAPVEAIEPVDSAEAHTTPAEPENAEAETEPAIEAVAEPVLPFDTTSVTLAPGEAAEIKLVMDEGATVSYSWSVDTGHVNYDTHGDNPSTKYHNYNKGKAVTGDSGVLTADFDGKHGWFWRNRSEETVTVILEVTGQFGEIVRVL